MNAKKKCKEAKKTHKKGCKEWNFIYFCKKNPKNSESSKKAKSKECEKRKKM